MAETQSDWQDGQLQVVCNDEGQYSLWPLRQGPPVGWHAAGMSGLKDECLAYIADVWTDMRPVSARR